MRFIAEFIGGVALLTIFAYGVVHIVKILKRMEIKNGKNESQPRVAAEPRGNDGEGGDKPG